MWFGNTIEEAQILMKLNKRMEISICWGHTKHKHPLSLYKAKPFPFRKRKRIKEEELARSVCFSIYFLFSRERKREIPDKKSFTQTNDLLRTVTWILSTSGLLFIPYFSLLSPWFHFKFSKLFSDFLQKIIHYSSLYYYIF